MALHWLSAASQKAASASARGLFFGLVQLRWNGDSYDGEAGAGLQKNRAGVGAARYPAGG